MSVSGISGSTLFNYQSTSVQNQQQQFQQQLQQLGQEFQAGTLTPQSTTQTTALTELGALQAAPAAGTGAASPAGNPTSPILSNVPQGNPVHGIYSHRAHHLRVDAGDDNESDTPDSNPLGQPPQPGSSSTAQQAYGAWQQDLQQVALNSDLLTAQAANWQPVSLSA